MRYPDRERSPGYQLWLATNAWQRVLRAALEPLDLTHAQFITLATLAILGETSDCINQVQVARYGMLDENMTSQVIRSLERKGLVERLAHPDDGRARIIRLTSAGVEQLAEAKSLVVGKSLEFFAPLGDRREEFIDMLRTLNADMRPDLCVGPPEKD